MKRRLRNLLVALVVGYVLTCTALYCFQEVLLFHPTKLSRDHVFQFRAPFEEKFIRLPDGSEMHSLLFRADSAKGAILYLHGNGGALNSWGNVAHVYTGMHYDVLMIDYPGFGKSDGAIDSEEEFVSAVQSAYDTLKKYCDESRIVVLGYSIGTGPATMVAARNRPRMLVLQAPYFSMKALSAERYPWVPSFILRYPLRTDEHIGRCTMPVVVFHGDQDQVIPYTSGSALAHLLKPTDKFITLHGWGHNGFTDSPEYLEAIRLVVQ